MYKQLLQLCMTLRPILVLFLILPASMQAQEVEKHEQELPGVYSGGADIADIDRDGDLDFFICGKDAEENPVSILYRNDGAEGFTAVNANIQGVWLGDAAFGDYNGDGYPDLAVIGATSAGSPYSPVLIIYRNNGGTFSKASTMTGLFGSSLDWGDYNKDGKPDLLVTGKSSSGETVAHIYQNGGGNRFVVQPRAKLKGVWMGDGVWADYDKDGNLDILLTGQSDGGTPIAMVYRSLGDWNFAYQSQIQLPGMDYSCASFKDYNLDGYPDILLAGKMQGNTPTTKIYMNDKEGNFVEQVKIRFTGVMAGDIAWGDYENNGYPDVLLTGRYAGNRGITKIFRNFGESFGAVPDLPLTGVKFSNASWERTPGKPGWMAVVTGQDASNKPVLEILQKKAGTTLSFQVRDKESRRAMRNATIAINGEELTTNGAGKANIMLKEGEYDYKVTYPGYVNVGNTVEIIDDDITENIELAPIQTLSLTLVKPGTQEPVPGAKIQIGERSITTDENGTASLDTLTGNYTCQIKAPGYIGQVQEIDLSGGNIEKTIELVPLHTLTLTIKNEFTGKEIRDASVVVAGMTMQTDRNGQVALDTTSGEYLVKVSKDGYIEAGQTVTMGRGDKNVSLTMEPLYELNIELTNTDTNQPMSNTSIEIKDEHHVSNAEGQVNLVKQKGSYPVNVEAFNFLPYQDTLNITDDDVNIEIEMVPIYQVVFRIENGNTNRPIEGAEIIVGEERQLTNKSGIAVVDSLRSGKYRYSIKINSETYSTQRFEIKNKSVQIKFYAN